MCVGTCDYIVKNSLKTSKKKPQYMSLFPGMSLCSEKALLAKCLNNYQTIFPNEYKFFPFSLDMGMYVRPFYRHKTSSKKKNIIIIITP